MKPDILRIGLSPCPNDTFIFDAMLHGKVDTEGLSFEPVMADVEELNRMAFEGELPVSKVSFHAYLRLVKDYVLLHSGSALGRGCGPLLIARESFPPEEAEHKKIAIPGVHTTANLLLTLAFPKATNKTALVFSGIEDAVIRGEFDCGLIIHENRFTYARKGLKRIMDLGEYWEALTGLPIPLGGIVVQRKLQADLQQKLNRIMKRSVDFALANPSSSRPFVAQHAQELSTEVIQAHIDLYVNDYTRDLGEGGKRAVEYLFGTAAGSGLIAKNSLPLFL